MLPTWISFRRRFESSLKFPHSMFRLSTCDPPQALFKAPWRRCEVCFVGWFL